MKELTQELQERNRDKLDNSEPMRHLYRSEGFLQVTGRSGDYKGKLVGDVMDEITAQTVQVTKERVKEILEKEMKSLSPYPDTPKEYLVQQPIKKLVDGEIIEDTIELINVNAYNRLKDTGRLEALDDILTKIDNI